GGPLSWGGHALVAHRLAFTHPATGEPMEFSCAAPDAILALATRSALAPPP
ncbi:hypothetical protein IIA16_06560, partial [bacterium]|nr:hypothetical protein [bacterium]